ncbi:ribonuclease HI [bacterium]|nr:ribonuclease HI [bacterium]
MTNRPRVTIYTDGGCRPNPGTGAWAAILIHGEHRKELVGGERETTNNRMEMLGAIKALESLKKPCDVDFHTDSAYLRNGITSWIHGWKRNGWKTKDGPVKNKDLWQQLDQLMGVHKVNWTWVKGHADNPLNNRCDELCTLEIDRLEAGGEPR